MMLGSQTLNDDDDDDDADDVSGNPSIHESMERNIGIHSYILIIMITNHHHLIKSVTSTSHNKFEKLGICASMGGMAASQQQ